MPNELSWVDLAKGDRVFHHEYGSGAIRSSSPSFIHIDWDNAKVGLDHHTAGIARWLKREE